MANSVMSKQHKKKLQLYAECYGMGDIKIGLTVTGQYPNKPIKDVDSG